MRSCRAYCILTNLYLTNSSIFSIDSCYLSRLLNMFEKQIVIDGKGPMLGRLASVIAKELLSGQRMVVVMRTNCYVWLVRLNIYFSNCISRLRRTLPVAYQRSHYYYTLQCCATRTSGRGTGRSVTTPIHRAVLIISGLHLRCCTGL